MSDDISALNEFFGIARLFPLPNLVLFPSVIQPLHIFEPRYRQMTAHALSSDRLLTSVLLRPDWEEEYEGRPAIHEVACLGKIVADQRLEDGRYNLLLRGLRRVRILEEISSPKWYRSARVELLPETDVKCLKAASSFRRKLGELVPRWFPNQAAVLAQFRRLLASNLSVGTLCDIFSFALPLDVLVKQQLLEQLDVVQRSQTLLEHLQAHAGKEASICERRFPPAFSQN
jgi:Lon protease-like protein